MKFSTFHVMRWNRAQTHSEAYAYQLAFIRSAEELGFYGVWPAEHHFRDYGICPSVLGFCSYVAAVTTRVRIGTAVVVVPFYNPLRLAEEVAQLDILSGGRLDLGLGRGYQGVEFDGFQISMTDSRERFRENLEIMKLGWREGRFSYDGRFTKVENVEVLPKPVQRPHPPIWMGATSPATAEIAGALGHPIMSDPAQIFEQSAEVVLRWRRAAAAAGHDPAQELIALRICHVAETDERAYGDIEALPKVDVNTGSAPIDRTGQWVPGYEFYRDVGWQQRTTMRDPRTNRQLLIGSPETVSRRVQEHLDAGYTHIICHFDFGNRMPPQMLRHSMELFTARVAPQFTSAASASG